MELTKIFSEGQYSRALESWGWLSIGEKVPRMSSLFGDTFFESVDGSWWLLDHLDGCLTQHWVDRTALVADLATEEGQDRHLLGSLAMAAHHRGIQLAADQVYAFVPHPMVSRDFGVDRIKALSFVVALHLAGQLHSQLR
jgi:hypothetical protein